MNAHQKSKTTRRKQFTHPMFLALRAVPGVLLLCASTALAQPEWNITGATLLIKGEGFADDWIPTPPLVGDTVTCFENAYIAGGLASDYGIGCNQVAREASGAPSFALAQILSASA